MKAKSLSFLTLAGWLPVLALSAAGGSAALTVHEWGTFTSVQGGDGVQLAWFADQASDLPHFVYDWSKPGLGRPAPTRFYASKVGLLARQRMETPVIYFYSDEPLTASVTVKFPRGLITEWFPQAAQIGPAVSHADLEAGKAHSPAVSYDSLVAWSGIQVWPARQFPRAAHRMPIDAQGAHYFAARETDAAFVSLNSRSTPRDAEEYERFLFYRGAGNFLAPLTVMTSADGTVTVTNSGRDPIAHLFLLQIRGDQAALAQLPELASGVRKSICQLGVAPTMLTRPRNQVRGEVSQLVEAALVHAGLYPREAAAMVKTWSDLWFEEEGVRVLYLLPRSWTDEILPITISPIPRELVRVMVGRAEIIPPATQRALTELRTRASSKDLAAQAQLKQFQRALGRFYPAADQLARNAAR